MCLFQIVGCIVTMGVAIFIFALAFSDDIRNDLSSINEHGRAVTNQLKFAKQLCVFTQYHSESKQLNYFLFTKATSTFASSFNLLFLHDSRVIGKKISIVFQPLFIVIFVWSIITICSGMLVVQLAFVEYLFMN